MGRVRNLQPQQLQRSGGDTQKNHHLQESGRWLHLCIFTTEFTEKQGFEKPSADLYTSDELRLPFREAQPQRSCGYVAGMVQGKQLLRLQDQSGNRTGPYPGSWRRLDNEQRCKLIPLGPQVGLRKVELQLRGKISGRVQPQIRPFVPLPQEQQGRLVPFRIRRMETERREMDAGGETVVRQHQDKGLLGYARKPVCRFLRISVSLGSECIQHGSLPHRLQCDHRICAENARQSESVLGKDKDVRRGTGSGNVWEQIDLQFRLVQQGHRGDTSQTELPGPDRSEAFGAECRKGEQQGLGTGPGLA